MFVVFGWVSDLQRCVIRSEVFSEADVPELAWTDVELNYCDPVVVVPRDFVSYAIVVSVFFFDSSSASGPP